VQASRWRKICARPSQAGGDVAEIDTTSDGVGDGSIDLGEKFALEISARFKRWCLFLKQKHLISLLGDLLRSIRMCTHKFGMSALPPPKADIVDWPIERDMTGRRRWKFVPV
jgi:hypothetical protein